MNIYFAVKGAGSALESGQNLKITIQRQQAVSADKHGWTGPGSVQDNYLK